MPSRSYKLSNRLSCEPPAIHWPHPSGGNGGLCQGLRAHHTFGGVQNITQGARTYIFDRDGKTARQWTYQEVLNLY